MINVAAKNPVDYKAAAELAQGLADVGFGDFDGSKFWIDYIPLPSSAFYANWKAEEVQCIKNFYENYDLNSLTGIESESPRFHTLLLKWYNHKPELNELNDENLKVLRNVYGFGYARSRGDYQSKEEKNLNRNFKFRIERVEYEIQNRAIKGTVKKLESTNEDLARENSKTQRLVVILTTVAVLVGLLQVIEAEMPSIIILITLVVVIGLLIYHIPFKLGK